eukprot:Amastigsp_a847495_4.p2 type:complete len:110 gc:universal Amastigsp_a847495_4:252-581(+)
MNVLSELRPRTPCGPGMCRIGSGAPPRKPRTSCARPLIEMLSLEPTLTGSPKSEQKRRTTPSMQSSTKQNERVCAPSPQSSKSTVDVRALRQNAAGAFSRPPFHVPNGP